MKPHFRLQNENRKLILKLLSYRDHDIKEVIDLRQVNLLFSLHIFQIQMFEKFQRLIKARKCPTLIEAAQIKNRDFVTETFRVGKTDQKGFLK